MCRQGISNLISLPAASVEGKKQRKMKEFLLGRPKSEHAQESATRLGRKAEIASYVSLRSGRETSVTKTWVKDRSAPSFFPCYGFPPLCLPHLIFVLSLSLSQKHAEMKLLHCWLPPFLYIMVGE